jgi:hypothetical protein
MGFLSPPNASRVPRADSRKTRPNQGPGQRPSGISGRPCRGHVVQVDQQSGRTLPKRTLAAMPPPDRGCPATRRAPHPKSRVGAGQRSLGEAIKVTSAETGWNQLHLVLAELLPAHRLRPRTRPADPPSHARGRARAQTRGTSTSDPIDIAVSQQAAHARYGC